jgi:cytochrome c oxidase assembly protein subunit 15
MFLHVFTVIVAASTALLIFVGGLVTSTGSGLSVPDWPNTYGWFMFSFPLDKMVGGIFYEHTHRLIASGVGFLILVLALWLWRVEPRRFVRRLGFVALAAVVTQGILGGITVLWFLPDPISIAHAGLAQLVFCLTTAIALFTSPGWQRVEGGGDDQAAKSGLIVVATLTTAVVYIQILVGATMRHTGAGLAIPDFPLAFGRLVPAHWDAGIAINFAHRIGAIIVSALVLKIAHLVFRQGKYGGELRRPTALLVLLLGIQVTLGGLTVLSGKQHIINSLHVVTGAGVLATSLVLSLRAGRRGVAAIVDAGSGTGPITSSAVRPVRAQPALPVLPGPGVKA